MVYPVRMQRVIFVLQTFLLAAGVLRVCVAQISPGLESTKLSENVTQYQGNIHSATQTNWAGISSYYLYGCNTTIRLEALNAMRAAGLKVLRVFLLSTEGDGAVPACKSNPVPDLEPKTVGVFDNTILERLDDLLFEASIRGLKVTVALHDRYSLGCWRSDSYQRKYNLTKTDCSSNPSGNDPTRFYTHGRDDFKRRIVHVLSYVSRHTGSALGKWEQALFSVEAENEAFGHAKVMLVGAWDREYLESAATNSFVTPHKIYRIIYKIPNDYYMMTNT